MQIILEISTNFFFLIHIINNLQTLKLFKVFVNYFLTKITLFIFFNNWVSRGKRKFCASRAVFLCNILRGNTVAIFLS